MPDWTYRTLVKPGLKALPRAWAGGAVLRSLGTLARMPGGRRVIEFFGHMDPDPRLGTEIDGLHVRTPMGVGIALDPQGIASAAWSRFGFGFIETNRTDVADQVGLPTWLRVDMGLSHVPGEGLAELPPNIVGLILRWPDAVPLPNRHAELRGLLEDIRRRGRHLRILVSEQVDPASPRPWERVISAVSAGAHGVRLEVDWNLAKGSLDPDRNSADCLRAVKEAAAHLRHQLGPAAILLAAGAESPADALELRRFGVDGVVLDSGMVRTGPGLPKRVNAALLFAQLHSEPEPEPKGTPEPWARRSWFWCALLGISMLLGGILAFAIGSTRVVLPYDEVWCGTSRAGFSAINPRLLSFMAHDRVTLAGTMVSIGGLYLGLAIGAVRHGQHWARVAIVASAVSGFLSFFLFLGFEYFDPFHAFVTAVLFQFLVMALYAPLGSPRPPSFPDLHNTAAWRCGQWGQLLFVVLGMSLVGAGLVIASIGVGDVFVREDLDYLQTSLEAIRSANARIIPVVAHDRASLGGMLIANGLAVWLTAQWGFTSGARWLWWTLVLSGIPAFAGTIAVHFAVGYTDLWHLIPAFLATAVFLVASMLAHGWLRDPGRTVESAWNSLLARPRLTAREMAGAVPPPKGADAGHGNSVGLSDRD